MKYKNQAFNNSNNPTIFNGSHFEKLSSFRGFLDNPPPLVGFFKNP